MFKFLVTFILSRSNYEDEPVESNHFVTCMFVSCEHKVSLVYDTSEQDKPTVPTNVPHNRD